MFKRIVNAAFVVGSVLLLLLGLGRAILRPREVNDYENRYAEELPSLTLSGWADGSFQAQLDAALADQLPLALRVKKAANQFSSRLLKSLLTPILQRQPERYVYFPGHCLFGADQLVYPTSSMAYVCPLLDARSENLNAAFAACPDTEFYLYYVEKDTDLNFETGEKPGIYEYLTQRLSLPAERMARFQVDDIQQFRSWFYRTDHHWNLDGSYRGYQELCALLGVEDAPLEPVERLELGSFSGSKGALTGLSCYQEPFLAYRFDYPEMTVTQDRAPVEDYGNQAAFFAGQGGSVSYGGFYGGDEGEVIFSTNRPERENLLIIGESYDNAVLKLLASHFNVTCSVDLRYYAATGETFRLTDYLAAHDIHKVLLMGNVDYFLVSDFSLEV